MSCQRPRKIARIAQERIYLFMYVVINSPMCTYAQQGQPLRAVEWTCTTDASQDALCPSCACMVSTQSRVVHVIAVMGLLFYLMGSSIRTCQATRLWSGSVPTCQGMLSLLHLHASMYTSVYSNSPSVCISKPTHNLYVHVITELCTY